MQQQYNQYPQGQQQYQQNMLPLYDKGLELYDRAYQGYRDQIGDQYNRYNLLAAADQSDYGSMERLFSSRGRKPAPTLRGWRKRLSSRTKVRPSSAS